MKKFKTALFALLFSAGFLLSCNGPEEPNFLTIVGIWDVKTIEANINEQSAVAKTTDEDISDQNIYIQFYSSLDFATNSDLSITKLHLAPSSIKTGTYNYFIDENGDNRLVLSFYDSVLQDEVALNFVIEDMDTNNPTLYMSKADYIKSLEETANELEATLEKSLKEFANRIIDASFSLKCEK